MRLINPIGAASANISLASHDMQNMFNLKKSPRRPSEDDDRLSVGFCQLSLQSKNLCLALKLLCIEIANLQCYRVLPGA